LFQIWTLKNYYLPSIPDDSGWNDEGGNIYSYDLSSLPIYTEGNNNITPNFIDFDTTYYSKTSYNDLSNNDFNISYYGNKLYLYSSTLADLDDLYYYLDSNPLGNIKFGLIDSISDSQALYYWNLYKDAINEVDRWEWYSDMGITAENFAYYQNLLADAQATEPRWEWYKDFGITSSNYLYYLNLLDDANYEIYRWEFFRDFGITAENFDTHYDMYLMLLNNYHGGIPFEDFNDLIVSTDREEIIPPPSKTWLESIEEYLDNLGLGVFAYIVISLLIMGLVLIPLALMKASFIVILIVEGLLFTMFSVFGWFPLWLVIIIVIILFVIILLQFRGGSTNDA